MLDLDKALLDALSPIKGYRDFFERLHLEGKDVCGKDLRKQVVKVTKKPIYGKEFHCGPTRISISITLSGCKQWFYVSDKYNAEMEPLQGGGEEARSAFKYQAEGYLKLSPIGAYLSASLQQSLKDQA